MAINYSIEDTQYIIDQYKNDPNRETVDRLAQELEKKNALQSQMRSRVLVHCGASGQEAQAWPDPWDQHQSTDL